MTPPAPPDPHPWVTALARPLASWLRVPAWAAVLAVLAWLLLLSHSSAVQDAKLAQALDDARTFLAGTKPFHGTILGYQQREAANVRRASTATAGMGRQLEAANKAESTSSAAAAKALAAAQTAAESIKAYQRKIAGDSQVKFHLRFSVDSGLTALASMRLALGDADSATAHAVRRADSAEARIRSLVRAESCHILWVLPCIRNVHVGPSAHVTVAPRQSAGFGLAVVWSP